MAQPVNESYAPRPLAASGLVIGANGGALGGFLCTTTGTVRLSYGSDGSGAAIVETFDVTEGVFYPMPFAFPPGVYVYATLVAAAGTFAA